MSLGEIVIRQRDFSAGEIDPNALRRDDRDEFKSGFRYGRNILCGNEGRAARRQGRSQMFFDSGYTDDFRPYTDTIFRITFKDSAFVARGGGGGVLATLSAPWSAAQLPRLRWTIIGSQIVVCGPVPLRPQVITFDREANSWSIADYAFATDLTGIVKAPFFRFDNKGATMQVSGLSGNITVTFSADVLDISHINSVFRYVGKQIKITGVTDARHGTATCLEPLNPTLQWSLVNADEMAGFEIGQIVQSSLSGTEMEVVAIDDDAKTITGIVTNRYRQRESGDRLVGPTSDADTGSTVTIVSPGATVQWDEQFMSDYRGWPQSVSSDVQRLIFCSFPAAKNYILWSSVAEYFNCLIGDEATDAILEYIPQECEVFAVIGGYDEFAMTSQGAYYIPISSGTPLQPGSVEFRLIYSGPIANVPPLQVTEGVMFVDNSLSRILAITATGAQTRPYLCDEITQYHEHLFDGVVALAATTGDTKVSGRQMFAVNADGSYVVGRYLADKQFVGWFKMNGAGAVRTITSRYDTVIFSVDYAVGGSTVSLVENLDSSQIMDAVIGMTADISLPAFAGATMQMIADGFYLGDVVVGADGSVAMPAGYSSATLGFKFDIQLQPLFYDIEGGQNVGQQMRRRKIGSMMMRVKDTDQFEVDERQFATRIQDEDWGEAPIARTETYRYRQLGRSYDPTCTIRQTIPGGFNLLELTTEITV